ncbi:MAG TPA: class I SAM-dependent methyltransferase [Solirubrobacterales bacterium]|jgi:ubiquinone/menaquinone biosynthesis C-methylase UbiE|nr:class I SAM-dependent methyltransferase [Solirubrobacterales bacterium]
MEKVAPANEEATEAWSGPLFESFVRFRDLATAGLGRHGERAMQVHPPRPGDRVLDVGCGFGDTSQQLAALVGRDGEVVGVDVSKPFVELARREAAEAGTENVSFEVGDAQVAELGQDFDYVFSRMGVMFFANPVAALRNIGSAMAPGGRLCMVVWRRKLDNEWIHRAELVVDRYLDRPEESDVPTCGPGPFSMANADTVGEQLVLAGFEDISFHRCDLPIKIGNDLDHAVEFNMALGPAAEVLRLWGDRVDELRPRLGGEIREAIADWDGPDGVIGPAGTWIIGARAAAV